MSLIHLQGQLICTTPEDRRVVLAHLPQHMRLTLREPGCLFFDITQDEAEPNIWHVNEGFATRAHFEAHQARMQASDWGRATLRIKRRYQMEVARPEIAPEAATDARALYLFNRAAFGGTDEAALVDALRGAGDLALSLVARFQRAYLGHVAFSPIKAPFPAWALAPLAVRESVRGQGIGAALVQQGLAVARARGVQAVFVLGDPAYYARFGFSVRAARGFGCPWSGPEFQMLTLTSQSLPAGALTYAPAFDAL